MKLLESRFCQEATFQDIKYYSRVLDILALERERALRREEALLSCNSNSIVLRFFNSVKFQSMCHMNRACLRHL